MQRYCAMRFMIGFSWHTVSGLHIFGVYYYGIIKVYYAYFTKCQHTRVILSTLNVSYIENVYLMYI